MDIRKQKICCDLTPTFLVGLQSISISLASIVGSNYVISNEQTAKRAILSRPARRDRQYPGTGQRTANGSNLVYL